MDWIGYQWLLNRYGVVMAQPLPLQSFISSTKVFREAPDGSRQGVPESMRPAGTLEGHLGFALKHEGVRRAEAVVAAIREEHPWPGAPSSAESMGI